MFQENLKREALTNKALIKHIFKPQLKLQPQSNYIGNLQIFEIFLLKTPFAVFSVTTRTKPSLPG